MYLGLVIDLRLLLLRELVLRSGRLLSLLVDDQLLVLPFGLPGSQSFIFYFLGFLVLGSSVEDIVAIEGV